MYVDKASLLSGLFSHYTPVRSCKVTHDNDESLLTRVSKYKQAMLFSASSFTGEE